MTCWEVSSLTWAVRGHSVRVSGSLTASQKDSWVPVVLHGLTLLLPIAQMQRLQHTQNEQRYVLGEAYELGSRPRFPNNNTNNNKNPLILNIPNP